MTRVVLGFMLLSLPVGVQIQGVDAPEVQVTLRTGEKRSGEILSVQEHSMLFHPKHGLSERDVVLTKELVEVIDADRIQEVTLPGGANVGSGIAVGLGLGCIIGYLIGESQPVSKPQGCTDPTGEQQRWDNGLKGGCIGGTAGSLVGAAVGNSIKDRIVVFGQYKRDFRALKGLARYPEEEPDFLEMIR